MSYGEFDRQMERLNATYGPKAYPDERKKLLWREFSAMSEQAFARIIDRLIGENAMAPMLPKFREIAAVGRELEAVREKQEFKRGMEAALQSMSLRQFIKSSIDGGNSKDLEGLVKLFGMDWVDRKYREARESEVLISEVTP